MVLKATEALLRSTVEVLTFLLQFACHVTVTDNSPTLSPGPCALQHRASLLSHTSTFLLLHVPVVLSPNPLPGCLSAHQYSEIIQAECVFSPIPFSSFLKSSLPPHQVWSCISFLRLSAQALKLSSLSSFLL